MPWVAGAANAHAPIPLAKNLSLRSIPTIPKVIFQLPMRVTIGKNDTTIHCGDGIAECSLHVELGTEA